MKMLPVDDIASGLTFEIQIACHCEHTIKGLSPRPDDPTNVRRKMHDTNQFMLAGEVLDTGCVYCAKSSVSSWADDTSSIKWWRW